MYQVSLNDGDLVVTCDSDGIIEKAEIYCELFHHYLDCTDMVKTSSYWNEKVIEQRKFELDEKRENREFDDI